MRITISESDQGPQVTCFQMLDDKTTWTFIDRQGSSFQLCPIEQEEAWRVLKLLAS